MNLVTNPVRPRMIATGMIEGQLSDDILIDSGADVTLVHPRLVPEHKRLNQCMEFGTSSGGLGSAQLAELDLDIMGRKQSVRVGVSETIPHDVLIGLDFADCPEMAAEVYRSQQAPNVSMVKTRSRTKAQLLNMPTVERVRGGTLRHQRSPRGCTAGVQEPSSHLFLPQLKSLIDELPEPDEERDELPEPAYSPENQHSLESDDAGTPTTPVSSYPVILLWQPEGRRRVVLSGNQRMRGK